MRVVTRLDDGSYANVDQHLTKKAVRDKALLIPKRQLLADTASLWKEKHRQPGQSF